MTATILMPLSGIGRSIAYARPVQFFGWPVIPKLFEAKQEAIYPLFEMLHDGTALLLAAALAIHVAASLKHHLVDRDETLRRMIGLKSRSTPTARP